MGFELTIGVETACVHLAIFSHIKLSKFESNQFPGDASLFGLLGCPHAWVNNNPDVKTGLIDIRRIKTTHLGYSGKQETMLLLLFELLYSQVFEANLITPE